MPDRAKHASTQALCHYQELCEVSVKVGADGDDVALTNSRKHVLSRRCEKNRGSLIGRRAMDGTSVLEILNFRGTLYAGFVHGIAEFGGGHKASSFVRAVPVQQQEQVVRVVGVVEESEPGLAGALALGQVGVECLLPAAVVRNLVADENVHHDSASQWFLLPRYRNLRLRGKSQKSGTDGWEGAHGRACVLRYTARRCRERAVCHASSSVPPTFMPPDVSRWKIFRRERACWNTRESAFRKKKAMSATMAAPSRTCLESGMAM